MDYFLFFVYFSRFLQNQITTCLGNFSVTEYVIGSSKNYANKEARQQSIMHKCTYILISPPLHHLPWQQLV